MNIVVVHWFLICWHAHVSDKYVFSPLYLSPLCIYFECTLKPIVETIENTHLDGGQNGQFCDNTAVLMASHVANSFQPALTIRCRFLSNAKHIICTINLGSERLLLPLRTLACNAVVIRQTLEAQSAHAHQISLTHWRQVIWLLMSWPL